MRWLLCFFSAGCGGTSVDREAGEHRSGDGCAPDRVFEETIWRRLRHRRTVIVVIEGRTVHVQATGD